MAFKPSEFHLDRLSHETEAYDISLSAKLPTKNTTITMNNKIKKLLILDLKFDRDRLNEINVQKIMWI